VEFIYSVINDENETTAKRLQACRMALQQAYRFQEVELLSGQLAVD
jgi:hypothetical protein